MYITISISLENIGSVFPLMVYCHWGFKNALFSCTSYTRVLKIRVVHIDSDSVADIMKNEGWQPLKMQRDRIKLNFMQINTNVIWLPMTMWAVELT